MTKLGSFGGEKGAVSFLVNFRGKHEWLLGLKVSQTHHE